MGKYRCMLVPFDGSDCSKNALKQAIIFGEDEGCRVTAVTVLRSNEGEAELVRVRHANGSGGVGDYTPVNSIKLVVEDKAEVQTILEEGVIHEAIIDVADKRNCDLIVMGRRGLSRIERAFVGSFSARVIRYSPIDVLVMPGKSVIGWDTILLATDGSEYSDVATEQVLKVALAHNSELKIVSVFDTSDNFYNELPGAVERMMEHAQENVEVVRKRAEQMGLKTEAFISEGEPHEQIVELAEELKADVICMGSHGRTGLERILMGSVTEKVIEKAKCPVLVVKSK